MIIAFLLALTLVSPPAPRPPPLKQCVNACAWDEDDAVWVCGYWERPKCLRKELECSQLVEGTICENNMQPLGTWNSGDGIREFRWNIPQSYPSPGSGSEALKSSGESQ